MLSLKKTIDGLDREEQRFHALLDCYLATLNAIQAHAVEVEAECTREFQGQVRALHGELREDHGLVALERSRIVLLEALQNFQNRSAESLSRNEEDLRGIIHTLGAAAETLSGHNEVHCSRLREFTAHLQVVARETDLGKMRMELTKKVFELRNATDSIWRENQLSVADMQAQLTEFQKRLERAESRASTDALTGLMNRGEGEVRLRKAIDSGVVVSVILIDLNGFKQVNDNWGHSAGDQVLKTFAHVLSQNARPMESICRWGGDEFIVILSCNEAAAKQRAALLRPKLRIRHKLVVMGRIIEADVAASLGVAQARSGEPVEDLLTRADMELYKNKNPSNTLTGALMMLEGGS